MARETWVYPGGGRPPYLKGSRPADEPVASVGPTVLGDLPDFLSPVDRKHYSGRAGMREHNARNDVVPVEDLKGLPYYTTTSDIRSESQKRAEKQQRLETINRLFSPHYR